MNSSIVSENVTMSAVTPSYTSLCDQLCASYLQEAEESLIDSLTVTTNDLTLHGNRLFFMLSEEM